MPAHLRQRYFGVNFTLLNLGIGIGGVVGGFYVDVDRVETFQAIYLADAASYVPAFCVLSLLLRDAGARVETEQAPGRPVDVLPRRAPQPGDGRL